MSVTVTQDFTQQLQAIIARFKNDVVLVGVPAEDSSRNPSDGGKGLPDEITNAQLLAIHELGSPANNIPARPVLKIGIRLAQEAIAQEFKKAAQNAFKTGALDTYYNRAGAIAANSVKRVFVDQTELVPLSARTLAQRKAEGFQGEKALIRTGQLRNSITWVVRSKG
jgi:phage gpG-like protein